MNCPYCSSEMELGYLRGSRSYELIWTTDPFKTTPLMLNGKDFPVCKANDVSKPIAYHCKACGKIIVDVSGSDC